MTRPTSATAAYGGTAAPDLRPGQERRWLTARTGEDADAAARRAEGMPWGGAIVGRPHAGKQGRVLVWLFAVETGRLGK